MSKILPEIHHEFTNLSIEKVKNAYENGDTVTGFVKGVCPEKEVVYVRLGDGIVAMLPFSETTIYPMRYSKKHTSNLPTNVKCLLKRKIRVKISSIEGNTITVSRKKNMMEAYNHIYGCAGQRISMYVTEVINKTAFGDVGEGICGKLFINDVCRSHIKHVNEIIKERETIEVIIKDYDDEHRVSVSYRDAFKPYDKEDYKLGDTIVVTIGDWIKVADTSDYYVSVTPQVPGIMIANHHIHLDYGSKAECTITGTSDKGLYLVFVKSVKEA